MRRRSLGRGLSELIAGDLTVQGRAVVEIPVDQIHPNRYQPRRAVPDDTLAELVQSIKTRGVIQPISVRPVGSEYEIVAGERRWRACQAAGLATVPCIVQDVSDQEALQMALIENLQREDLSSIEAAHAYRKLINDFGLTQDQVASLIGKSRSAIANTLRLLDLPEEIQNSIHSGTISEGHGRALLGLSEFPEILMEAWMYVEANDLSVRETEELVRRKVSEAHKPPVTAPKAAGSATTAADPNLVAVQEALQMALGTRVRIKRRARGGGTIIISYHDDEELTRLVETIVPPDTILGTSP